MKTIYFENSNVIGFEVTTANDVIKAQELGLFICNKDEYYFDEYVTELDEDGIETEREATKDERMERIIKALKEGQQLYASFNFASCIRSFLIKSSMFLVPITATRLRSFL